MTLDSSDCHIAIMKRELAQTDNLHFPVQREFYDTDFLSGIRVKF